MVILGVDIGGTKCAVITAQVEGDRVQLLGKEKIPTRLDISPRAMLEELMALADTLPGMEQLEKIGVSCGGPLDAERGLILAPPSLTGWDRVPVTEWLEERYRVPAKLQNDANAGAVAEWKFGAGRGCRNMVFLTFGTGFGAGLILDGRLYDGTNGNAGEVGHVRLAPFGPSGYGKVGSAEGFCSGGGLAQLGYTLGKQAVQQGLQPTYFANGTAPEQVTAKSIAEAALAGDETARQVYRLSGEYLGRSLAILIDLLNPERIVIGSVFARSEGLLRPAMEEAIAAEALPQAAACCQVVPATLGENIGDYAAVATALL